jgi:hypothetical protein
METEEKEKKARTNRIVASICFLTCHVGFLIAIIIVLAIDTSSCNYPIRAWLIVYACLSIIGTLGSLLFHLLSKENKLKSSTISRLYALYHATMLFFFITWTILGSVWVYKDDSCKQGTFYADFSLGWRLLVAILAIQYLIFIACSFAGCLGLAYVLAQHYYLSRRPKP